MRYVDGELDVEEAARVEGWLSRSAEARAFYGDLELVRRQVRAIADDRGSRSGALTDAIMARIGSESPASRPAARRRSSGSPSRLHAVIPAMGLALAAAAAVVVFVRSHSGARVFHEPARVAVSKEPPAAVSAAVADTAASEPESGASIESVDLGTQNGAIFMVATGPDVTPVVWLTDDGDPSNG